MIQGFRSRETENLFKTRKVEKGTPGGDVANVALRKLAMLNAAVTLEDLRIPPSNRLEALKGDRDGQHSIRINDKWRVCFVWTDAGPKNVEIVDYH